MLIRFVKLLLLLLTLWISWLLAFGNNQSIELSFMAWQSPALPLFFWLFIVFFGGLLLGVIIGRLMRLQRSTGKDDQ